MPKLLSLSTLLILLVSTPLFAQEAVVAEDNHAHLLTSDDEQLVKNKKLVYDFWREVFEAGHLELADQYLAESYIQHNPNVPTGREGFVNFFSAFKKRSPIQDKVQSPLVSIIAEGDMVVLSFVSEKQEPNDPDKTYTTTWFDMFRIEDNKIIEHWDPMLKM